MTEREESVPALVVTGASSGLGRAFAAVAGPRFRAVLLVARSEKPLAETAAELRRAGVAADHLVLDLGMADAGDRIEQALSEKGWYADVIINAAGFGLIGLAHEISLYEQLALIDLNVRMVTDLALRFLPGMVARRRGGIVMLGSPAGYFPGPGMAVYYASKAFVRSLSDALHAETKGTGVTVTCVSPGPVKTEFFRRSGAGKAWMFKIQPRLDARAVAESGWNGFRAGRRVVVSGLLNKALVMLSGLVPTAIMIGVIKSLHKPKRSSE